MAYPQSDVPGKAMPGVQMWLVGYILIMRLCRMELPEQEQLAKIAPQLLAVPRFLAEEFLYRPAARNHAILQIPEQRHLANRLPEHSVLLCAPP